MPGTSTIYDVKVKYNLEDKASGGVKQIASATDRAAQSAFSLKSALAAVGGFAILHKGKEALIDFNSEIEQMKIGMTAVMQMQLHMPFKKASEEADKLFKTFQELAKKSPATTKDFMEMANAIAPAVAAAGGGPSKLAKLTQGGVIASLAMGERADVVGRDIKQMLAGTVGVRDPIAMQLLASKGIDHKDFNAKSGTERAKLTEDLLGNNQAFKDAADRMGESFAGQVSTFKDSLQITLGQVGLPLMQAMSAEVKRWNNWIEKHPKLIKEWVTSFGEKIKAGFEFLKGVGQWFVEHKDLLMSLAKTFVLFKGASIATNVFQRFTQGVGGMADSIKNAMSGFASGGVMGAVGGFGKLIPVVGTVIQGLTLFSGALEIASSLLNNHAEEDRKAREKAISLNEATGEVPGMMSRRGQLKTLIGQASDPDLKNRLMQEQQNLDKKLFSPETLGLALRKINEASEQHGGISLKALPNDASGLLSTNLLAKVGANTFDPKNIQENTRIMQQVDATLKAFQNLPSQMREEALKFAFPEQYGMPTPDETPAPDEGWKNLKSADVNVTINKVEVASEDPDRFVFGLVQIADQAIKHSTQSQHILPGGL